MKIFSFSLQKIYYILPQLKKDVNTNSKGLYNIQIVILWMSDVLVHSLSNVYSLHLIEIYLFHVYLFALFLISLGCYKITTVFSHAQSEIVCGGCFTILCMPTGGKARLTEGNTRILCYLISRLSHLLKVL